MAKPAQGEGRYVQTELPLDIHERMKLELIRRQRQGSPATIEALAREMILANAHMLPRLPEDFHAAR